MKLLRKFWYWNKFLVLIGCAGLFLLGCSVEPSPIEYGKDSCNFCAMTIVDNQHAAELVTNKGKVFKYDAIECMVNELRERNQQDYAFFLFTDYMEPGKFVDARKGTFLISENITSPMGANLTGFQSDKAAAKMQAAQGGELFSWEELLLHFYK